MSTKQPKAKRGRGQPPFAPTPEHKAMVQALCCTGATHTDIAKLMGMMPGVPDKGIDNKTLRKHFRNELDFGEKLANANVVAALYRNATKLNNVSAQIWWTKNKLGWRSCEPKLPQDDDGSQDAPTVAAKLRAIAAEMEKATNGTAFTLDAT